MRILNIFITRPLLSRYVSFNTREILYERFNGTRYIKKVYRKDNEPFPIETTLFLEKRDIEYAKDFGLANLIKNKPWINLSH